MIEQQPGENIIPSQAYPVGLRDNASEERGVAAEAFDVDRSLAIYIGALTDQPPRNLYLIEINTQVQQGSASQRSAMQRERMIRVAAQPGRIKLLVRESAVQHRGILADVPFEKIDSSAMDCQRGCVRQGYSVAGGKLEALVLAWRIAAVGLQHEPDGSKRITFGVGKGGSQLQKQFEAGAGLRLARTHDRTGKWARSHRMQPARCVDPALQTSAIEGKLQILGTQPPEHLDDGVLTEVGGVGHGRPPVAGNATSVFAQQAGIAQHQIANSRGVASPDGVGEAAGGHQARPVGKPIASGQSQLRIGKPGRSRCFPARKVPLKFFDRRTLAVMEGAEQILGLVAELFKVGTNREMTIRSGSIWHTDLLKVLARGPRSGERRFVKEQA